MTMLALGASLVATVIAVDARADAIQLVEKPGHVTEARAVIDAPPESVYALVTSYAAWPTFLSDVRSVRVEQGDRHHARVRFKSRALEHTVTVEFTNQPDRVLAFRGVKGPPGGRARGEYRLEPIDNGTRTYVVATLYLDLKGPASWFVDDDEIEAMRRDKLRADLEDVARYFQRQQQPVGAAR